MTMVNKVNELRSKKQRLELGGGQERIDKQLSSNKMTARQRLELLFDEGTFVEVGGFIETRSIAFGMQEKKISGDGVVTGYGSIDGRLIYASAQDFTVIGGSLGEMHAKKITNILDMAMKMGAPVISINDSGGARIEEGLDALSGFGDIFYRNTLASGVIPQISVIMGPCAGGAVYSPAITDFTIMVEKTSQMFITGPSVIEAVTGEKVTFEELGGAGTHNEISGNAHFKYADEKSCIEGIKKLLSYLPDNNLSGAPFVRAGDDMNRLSDNIYNIIPDGSNSPYDVKDIIKEVVDFGDFFEVQADYAKNLVVGFARINAGTVGIVANNPKFLAGSLDVNSSDKGARFVRFCDSFNIPLVTFTDVPGYLPGKNQEHNGIIRHGAKLLYAFSEATVPKINVILRKAYGGAYIAMNSKHLGADMVYAWPSAEIAVMGPDGAANIIFRKDIANSDDPINFRAEKIQEYKDEFSNPYVAATRGYVDDVIDPGATRVYISSSLDMLSSKSESRPKKKHGNIPL
ncbi:MAG: methylmalonyl-CoA carboxyltransferase [Clostridia bacterium]|nr:methylmalonyl-CoA carboxyltransferase [Clostridia bacterium]